MAARSPLEVLQEATDGAERLLRLLRKNKTAQVKSKEEQQLVKATTLAWFNNQRGNLVGVNHDLFKAVEAEYSALFECAARATSREKYLSIIKNLKSALLNLQSNTLSNPPQGEGRHVKPDFSPLVPDAQMRSVLENRWDEIAKCLVCEAPLAATIMMGGLLETLFLAQVNKTADKSLIFKAKTAPKNPKTKKVLPLNEWTLNTYIEVGAELGWITKPAKEIGIVLRNYRNFIHPERELSTGITLTPDDAQMFWSVSTQLTQQILARAKRNN